MTMLKRVAADAEVRILTMPLIDPARGRVEMVVPAGTRICDMLGAALPGWNAGQWEAVRVYVDGQLILPSAYRARPKPGTLVVIRPIPTNGGVRTALQVAVMVAGYALGGPLGNLLAQPLIASLGSIAGTVVSAAVTAGVVATGNLLLNAFIPATQDSDKKTSPTYGLSSWRNVENPDGPVPLILGFHRIAPVIAASTYTEIVGDDQYMRFLFLLGYGPLDISNLRIGDTPIDQFPGIEFEVRYGYPDDAPVTYYTQQVVEEQVSIELGGDGDEPHVRTTQSDVTEISIDITWPGGLFYMSNEGEFLSFDARFRIEYVLDGSDAWVTHSEPHITARKKEAIRRTFRWSVPVRGRYQVRVRRLQPPVDDPKTTDTYFWTVLRSHRPEYPLNFTKPVALLCGRIKASKELNGTLDTLTADVKSICPDWDEPTQTWVTRVTNSPASLFRHKLQASSVLYPKLDSEIDLETLQDWHEFCAAAGLRYNRIIDYEATQREALRSIAAAGRATQADTGSKISVVIDRPRTHIVAPISPRNSWEFEWRQPYTRLPDGYRSTFYDETDDYKPKERIVPWPGFEGDPQRVEDISLEGITDPAQVYLALRRRQLELIYRPDQMSVLQDWQNFEVARGDLVALSTDVMDITQVPATVTAVAGNLIELSEPISMLPDTDYGVRFFRAEIGTWSRSVARRAGPSRLLTLTGVGGTAAVGDDVFVGRINHVEREVIVNRIERMDDSRARLHFLRHAPEIDAILGETEVPAWDGGSGGGGTTPPDETPPAIPSFSLLSGYLVRGDAVVINVTLSPGPGSVPVSTYDVRHRLVGAGSWTEVSGISSGDSSTEISGYDVGDEVEISARATSYASIVGDWSGGVEHEVGATDPPGATTPSDFSATLATSDALLSWRNPNDPRFASAHIWRATSGAPFSAATDISGAIFGAANMSMSRTDASPGTGDWDYWVTAQNTVGLMSPPVGPQTVTIP